jgi:hypothetical protein
MRALIVPLCVACAMGVAHAQPATTAPAPKADAQPELGRLFYSAAEREERERERAAPKAREQAAAPDLPAQVRINGYIARTGRTSLPVVDGKVLEAGASLSGLRISGGRDGRVRVSTDGGPTHSARPGQTLEIASGETTEWYDQAGRRRAAAAAPALPLPYTSGNLPGAEPTQPKTAAKPRKPRRGHTRRHRAGDAATPAQPPAIPTAPTVKPAAAPAPAIPAPAPAPLVKP